jgi:hypothetical protein
MIEKIASFLAIILVIVAIGVWFTHDQVTVAFAQSITGGSSALPPSISLTQFTPAETAQEQTTQLPNFDGDGVVFLDTADGNNFTPYIAYETPQGGLGIKELVFLKNTKGNDVQPCQVSAGEYPCVPDLEGNYTADSDASPVPSGTLVHVVGGVEDQAIIVQTMTTAPSLPNGVITFSLPLNGTATLSNGITIAPTEILTNPSCTLGVGCYGSDTQRLVTVITQAGDTKTTEIVPGTISVYDKTSFVLLSITGSGSSATANFLASKY